MNSNAGVGSAALPEFGIPMNVEPGSMRLVDGGYSNPSVSDGESHITLMEMSDQRLVSFAGGEFHGSWDVGQAFAEPTHIDIRFDCKAREGREKTTRIYRRAEGIWRGYDYRSRDITVRFKSASFYAGDSTWHRDWESPAPMTANLPPSVASQPLPASVQEGVPPPPNLPPPASVQEGAPPPPSLPPSVAVSEPPSAPPPQ